MSAASRFKKSSVNLTSVPSALLKNCPLVKPIFSKDFSNLDFSIAQEYIFQKSSSAVYKSCDIDFNFDKGFNNNLIPLSDVMVSPKFTSSISRVRSPSLTLEFTTPSSNSS